MSAALALQKDSSTSSSAYSECGEIFSSAPSTEHQKQPLRRTSGSVAIEEITRTNCDKQIKSLEQRVILDRPKSKQCLYHGALTRTISQPPPQQDQNVEVIFTTLLENFGNMNLHRKLERTQSEPLPQQVNTSRYKTELCRPFEEAGECKYGEKCQFAHGYHELRNLQRHPKYKTEFCRTFHSVGFCPYGPRCHFVHNADEARALQQLQQQKLQNHSNFQNCAPNYQLQPKQGSNTTAIQHSVSLSPPLSMSTGSDRESPTGSLSLSPTNSITNFTFRDQISPVNSVFQTTFSYINTPPESPNAPISPVNTPPPAFALNSMQTQPQMYIKPVTIQGKQILQKSSSSPIAVIKNVTKTPTKVNSVSSLINTDDARLPIFNQLRSAVERFPNADL